MTTATGNRRDPIRRGNRFSELTPHDARIRVSSMGMTVTGQGAIFPLSVDEGVARIVVVHTGSYELKITEIDRESAEYLADSELMKSLREADEDVRAGRTISGDELRGS